jgi:hypothetical protein
MEVVLRSLTDKLIGKLQIFFFFLYLMNQERTLFLAKARKYEF